jgi:hypothetical protein
MVHELFFHFETSAKQSDHRISTDVQHLLKRALA